MHFAFFGLLGLAGRQKWRCDMEGNVAAEASGCALC